VATRQIRGRPTRVSPADVPPALGTSLASRASARSRWPERDPQRRRRKRPPVRLESVIAGTADESAPNAI
jgi:hypothetical protein